MKDVDLFRRQIASDAKKQLDGTEKIAQIEASNRELAFRLKTVIGETKPYVEVAKK